MPKYQPIFKFSKITNHLYENLINGQLYFSSPKDFNDPFDCNFKLSDEITNEQLITHYIKYKGTEDNNVSEFIIEKINSNTNQKKQVIDLILNMFKDIANKQGVCCFSMNPAELLLWAHYSDCHKGICLEFDFQILKGVFQLSPVIYSKNFPIINVFDDDLSIPLQKYFCTKSTHWKYEKEIRILMPKQGLVRFPKEALKRVVFGLKTSEEEIVTIMRILKACGYGHVKCSRTSLSADKFELMHQGVELEYLK